MRLVAAAAVVLVVVVTGGLVLFLKGGGSGTGSAGIAGAEKEVGAWNATLTAKTVVVGGNDASGKVRSISVDGRTFVLDPAIEGVGGLQVGKTMLLSRVAVARVVDVHATQQGIVVDTQPAALTDLIKSGGFTFSGPVDLAQARAVFFQTVDDCPERFGLPRSPGQGAPTPAQRAACELTPQPAAPSDAPNLNPSPTPSGSSSGGSPSATATGPDVQPSQPSPSVGGTTPSLSTPGPQTSGVLTSSLLDGSSSAHASSIPSAADPPCSVLGSVTQPQTLDSAGLDAAPVAPQGGSASGNGTFGIWNWKMALAPAGGGVNMNLTAQTQQDGGIVRVDASGHVSSFTAVGQVQITGCTPHFSLAVKGLSGSIDVRWQAGSSKPVFANRTTWHPTVALVVPIGYVGLVPISVRIAAGISIAPAFTAKDTTSTGAFHADFSGSLSFEVSGGSVTPHSGITLTNSIGQHSVLSLGPSAFLVAVQFPQIGLGIGTGPALTPSNITDVVLSTSTAVSGFVSGLPCQQTISLVTNGIRSANIQSFVTEGAEQVLSHSGKREATKC